MEQVQFLSVLGPILKDVHALIPSTYKCVTLHSKKNFVGVIKVIGLKINRF